MLRNKNIIKLLKGFINHFKKEKPNQNKPLTPTIIPRALHSISRNDISRHALKVLYRLHESGYSAYLVGGCVRDLLLGFKPKDFDVATDALPEDIRKLFKNCRLIGKRFRLAHILFGREIIEVATFRAPHENATHEHHAKTHQGMIVRDNVYGTIEDDVFRRDFRINALYYNIADFSLVDYTGGMDDIKTQTLHMIGDPEKRFVEDPVRLIRAVRFIAKCNMHITRETEEPLARLGYLLEHVSSARLLQEVLKIVQGGALLKTIHLLEKYHLFVQLFPLTAHIMHKPTVKSFIEEALKSTDLRIQDDKNVSPAFFFAVLLWHPVQKEAQHLQEKGLPIFVALDKAIYLVLKEQTQRLALPRLMQSTIREICALQHRLGQRRGTIPYRLLEHPRFRAAYDLLILRATTEETLHELASWWTEFQTVAPDQREKMLQDLQKMRPPHQKKRRRRKTTKHQVN